MLSIQYYVGVVLLRYMSSYLKNLNCIKHLSENNFNNLPTRYTYPLMVGTRSWLEIPIRDIWNFILG